MMEIKQENEEKTTRRDGNNNNGNTLHSFVSTHHQTLGLDQNLQRQHQQARSPVNLSDRVTGSKSKPPTIHAVRYRECLKNHAANSGGNIFDGCGEFMPSGEEGSLEALKCAACDCHRNFHRKEIDGESSSQLRRSAAVMLNPLQLPPPLPSPTMMHHQKYSISMHTMSPSSAIVAPMNVAFGGGMSGGGATDQSSSEDLNVFHSSAADVVLQPPPPPPFALSKKRFRTKFTHEQKDQMTEFAEKIEWRFQKQDEEEIERFCARVGIKRQVFKVWMHNNKNNALKNILKQQPDPSSSNAM